MEVRQFYFGLPNLCDPCAVLEKLRRLMFSRDLLRPCFARLLALLVGQPDRSATGAFPLHGFALFNHNQETLFCSDYSGLRPIYATQSHPKNTSTDTYIAVVWCEAVARTSTVGVQLQTGSGLLYRVTTKGGLPTHDFVVARSAKIAQPTNPLQNCYFAMNRAVDRHDRIMI